MERSSDEYCPKDRETCERWTRIRNHLRTFVPRHSWPALGNQMLGRYRLRRVLGAGATSTVYLARDNQLDRPVAIKVFDPGGQQADLGRQQFLHAARCAAAIVHPHVVSVYDIGHDHDLEFMVMEYIDGCTLDKILPKKGFAPQQALRYACQLASAVDHIHSAGMIHRDLTPANIMIARKDVKLLDFGLADYVHQRLRLMRVPSAKNRSTRPAGILGTIGYMSPEQVQGAFPDGRSDIFSFGTVFFEMLTGRRLFNERSNLGTLSATLHQPISQLPGRIPVCLTEILMRCLQKCPCRRYKTAAHLLSDLDQATRQLGPASTI